MSDVLMAENWTLTCAGVTKPAAAWGVTDLVRRRVSPGADVCCVHVDGCAVGMPPVFAHGETVAVARNGVTWFVGRVTAVPASGDGAAEGLVYRLSGPWWYAQQLVAQQEWNVRGGAGSAWTSRLILGQAMDGSSMTTGGVIVRTLQDVMEAGAPFQIGTVDPALVPPLDEVRELTGAEVVEVMLRWHPDCVAWFDYATAPVPTWHCRQRGNLPLVTLAVGSAPLAEVRDVTARHDLVAPAVVLNYEVGVEGEDGTWFDVVTDAAPAGATGREFGAVVGTIPLRTTGAVTDARAAVRALVGGSEDGTDGLAAGLFAALSELPYSGSVVLVEGPGELGAGGVELGRVLNLEGSGAADWAAMRALVVEEEVRVATGTTVLRFGPPEGDGREAGSPGLGGTLMSGVRVSGRIGAEF